jgi:hypothetical protein
MDRIDRWKLADELTAYQIALLICGYGPAEFEEDRADHWPKEVSRDISPFLNAIMNAARSQKLQFTPVRYENSYSSDDIDWTSSTVDIESLCEWLRRRNFKDGFFVGRDDHVDKISDPSGEHYAPKLAAAVRAWNEVTADPTGLNRKTPKKALEIWLRKHANEYGLAGKDGNPNELGIEEICKVANWKLGGGASPTPTQLIEETASVAAGGWSRKARPNPPTPKGKSPTPRLNSTAAVIDDDIPF